MSTSPVSLSHFQIAATLCHNQLYIHLLMLIDLSAEDSFLHLELAFSFWPLVLLPNLG